MRQVSQFSQSEVHSETQSTSPQVTKVKMILWQHPTGTRAGVSGTRATCHVNSSCSGTVSPHMSAGEMLDQVLDIEPPFDSFCLIYKPSSQGLLLIPWAIQCLFSKSLFHIIQNLFLFWWRPIHHWPYSDERFWSALLCFTLVRDQGLLDTRYQWLWEVIVRLLKVAETLSGGLQLFSKNYWDIICLFHGATFSLIHKQWLK